MTLAYNSENKQPTHLSSIATRQRERRIRIADPIWTALSTDGLVWANRRALVTPSSARSTVLGKHYFPHEIWD